MPLGNRYKQSFRWWGKRSFAIVANRRPRPGMISGGPRCVVLGSCIRAPPIDNLLNSAYHRDAAREGSVRRKVLSFTGVEYGERIRMMFGFTLHDVWTKMGPDTIRNGVCRRVIAEAVSCCCKLATEAEPNRTDPLPDFLTLRACRPWMRMTVFDELRVIA